MGLDAYLYKCKNLKQIREFDWWSNDSVVDLRDDEALLHHIETDGQEIGELWYGRKFWDLHNYITTLLKEPYENGNYVEITKDMLEKIVIFAALHQDYFDDFNTVPQLCRALKYYDELRKKGWIYVYEADW